MVLVAVEHTEASLLRQFGNVEREERFGDGHIDKHRSRLAECSSVQGFIHKTVAVPTLFFGARFRQRHASTYKPIERIGLGQSLTVELVDPLLRSVGCDDDERYVLTVSLCHSRSGVEQSRTRCDAYHGGALRVEGDAHGVERCRTLIGDGMAAYRAALVEVVHDGSIATARAHHRVRHPPFEEQRCEYVYVFLVAVHYFVCCRKCFICA